MKNWKILAGVFALSLMVGCSNDSQSSTNSESTLDTSEVKAVGTANKILLAYYSEETNYKKVYDRVIDWFGTPSAAGVAFVATALKLSNAADIPLSGDIATITLDFSNFLQNKLGWKKITNYENLQPGDVVFAKDAPNDPGFPAHTYVFISWSNRSTGMAYAIDNLKPKYIRNMNRGNYTPFGYALRSPN